MRTKVATHTNVCLSLCKQVSQWTVGFLHEQPVEEEGLVLSIKAHQPSKAMIMHVSVISYGLM